ncbi:MarR family transcriptional regulator [Microbacterium sp. BG28]|uniref:helix-turn-helix transcriptional regulator n=2 Tax=unclassified Microbacterium TaxID=2609290 RepID=UPI002A5AEB48|nr:MarR family transcriptional regulator [Microbacterium sp. BG28]MDY0829837.1 MarR family transcriptional regulator [Microbacterium sp. BG28]
MPRYAEPMGQWTFLTNHAHVLIYVSRDPGARVREIADAVGITERTAHGILTDLVDDGYLRRIKEGRRNRYECVENLPLRHPVESDHRIGELLRALGGLTPSS